MTLQLILIPEVLMQKHEQGMMVLRISSMIDPEKITSIRAISLPGELKGADGEPLPKAGTAVRLRADQVLVDLSDEEFLKLLEALLGRNVLMNMKIQETVIEEEDIPTIKFPGKD